MAIKPFVYEMSLAVWTHKHTGMHEFVSGVTLSVHTYSHTHFPGTRREVHNALRNV